MSERNFAWSRVALLAIAACTAQAQSKVELAAVSASAAERRLTLPGELQPYQQVAIHAKVAGFVERVLVDRGSVVKHNQLLATLDAPELKTQRAEAESKVKSVEAQLAEAQARLSGQTTTYERLKAASATPGAVAGNELTLAEQAVEAARAHVRAVESSIQAAKAAVKAVEDIAQYLQVTAPFDGVITERNVHPGALVGRSGDGPLFHMEQNTRLRLSVAVPEMNVAAIAVGANATFTVPARPGETFHGVISRVSHSVDPKTRAMTVEIDVLNPRSQLAPGMYASVTWPVRRDRPVLMVPATSVVTTTEQTFVIRSNNGVAEWVPVSKGPASGDSVEVIGPLQPGDQIVKRATDEIRAGTHLR